MLSADGLAVEEPPETATLGLGTGVHAVSPIRRAQPTRARAVCNTFLGRMPDLKSSSKADADFQHRWPEHQGPEFALSARLGSALAKRAHLHVMWVRVPADDHDSYWSGCSLPVGGRRFSGWRSSGVRTP